MGFLGTRRWMSALGQTRKSGMTPVTSGLPQQADIVAVMSLFDLGPQVDMVARSMD